MHNKKERVLSTITVSKVIISLDLFALNVEVEILVQLKGDDLDVIQSQEASVNFHLYLWYSGIKTLSLESTYFLKT